MIRSGEWFGEQALNAMRHRMGSRDAIDTVIEREGRRIRGRYTVTVDDPKTYTMDWMNVRTWRIKKYPDVIMEYSCEENNKDLREGHIKGWIPPAAK